MSLGNIGLGCWFHHNSICLYFFQEVQEPWAAVEIQIIRKANKGSSSPAKQIPWKGLSICLLSIKGETLICGEFLILLSSFLFQSYGKHDLFYSRPGTRLPPSPIIMSIVFDFQELTNAWHTLPISPSPNIKRRSFPISKPGCWLINTYRPGELRWRRHPSHSRVRIFIQVSETQRCS